MVIVEWVGGVAHRPVEQVQVCEQLAHASFLTRRSPSLGLSRLAGGLHRAHVLAALSYMHVFMLHHDKPGHLTGAPFR